MDWINLFLSNKHQFFNVDALTPNILLHHTMNNVIYVSIACALRAAHYLLTISWKLGYLIITNFMSFLDELLHPLLLFIILYITNENINKFSQCHLNYHYDVWK